MGEMVKNMEASNADLKSKIAGNHQTLQKEVNELQTQLLSFYERLQNVPITAPETQESHKHVASMDAVVTDLRSTLTHQDQVFQNFTMEAREEWKGLQEQVT